MATLSVNRLTAPTSTNTPTTDQYGNFGRKSAPPQLCPKPPKRRQRTPAPKAAFLVGRSGRQPNGDPS